MIYARMIVSNANNFISLTSYSPFGMVTPGRSFAAGDGYRFGFQNQEVDSEVKGLNNSLNYTYRMHDPRIGRFFSVDPLTRKYPYYSAYQFSGNKVIAWREFEGLEESKAGNAGTYIALLNSGYSHGEAQQVINDMKIAEADAASYFTILYGGLVIIATGGLIMEIGVGTVVACVLEEGVEFTIEKTTGLVIIVDPVDVFEKLGKKGIKRLTTPVIVEGRRFAAGTNITTMRKWAYNVKTHGKVTAEHLSSGKFKFGKSRTISGEYNNAAKKEVHLDKRNQQGYDFKDVAEMEAYSKDFFAREGNNIIELEQNGYIHRIDTKTQEYGVINPNGKVETVFKVTPNENSKFKNAQEYLNNQVKQ